SRHLYVLRIDPNGSTQLIGETFGTGVRLKLRVWLEVIDQRFTASVRFVAPVLHHRGMKNVINAYLIGILIIVSCVSCGEIPSLLYLLVDALFFLLGLVLVQ